MRKQGSPLVGEDGNRVRPSRFVLCGDGYGVEVRCDHSRTRAGLLDLGDETQRLRPAIQRRRERPEVVPHERRRAQVFQARQNPGDFGALGVEDFLKSIRHGADGSKC